MNTADTVRRVSIASSILFCIGIGPLAWSAQSGSIRVQVLDRDGKPIKDAQITLYRESKEAAVGAAQTGDDGMAQLENLEPALDYKVKVAKPDYAPVVYREIQVYAGKRVSLPFTLRRASELVDH